MLEVKEIQEIWKLCAWIGFSAMLVIPFLKSLAAYQQNRYKMDRYGHWLWKQFRYEFRSVGYYLLLAMPYILMEYSSDIVAFLVFIGFTIFYIMCRYYKCDWKRLFSSIQWTMRMIRSTVVFAFLQFGWMYGVIQYAYTTSYGWGCIFAFVGSWLLIPVVWLILYPVEWLIGWFYRREAHCVMEEFSGINVAITGSYGKTSCKYILNAMLSQRYYGMMTPKSYNTAMGIAYTIRKQLKPFHEYFLCEMGSDHPGEIGVMMDIACPKYGVVTAIGPQHLQTFGTMRNIVEEKMSLVEKLPSDGIAFLNKDNAYIREYPLKNTCRVVWFSMQSEADYQVVNMYQNSQITQFTVLVEDTYYEFETKLLGKHNVMNLVAMLAVAHTLGMTMTDLQAIVKNISCVEHRLERKQWKGRTLIDNSYSSNPESMQESLVVLAKMENKRVVVTPGLVDLAQMQESTNQLFGSMMKDKADAVVLVGEEQTRSIYRGLEECGFDKDCIFVVASMQEGLLKALEITRENDTILIENDLPDVFYSKADLQKGGK